MWCRGSPRSYQISLPTPGCRRLPWLRSWHHLPMYRTAGGQAGGGEGLVTSAEKTVWGLRDRCCVYKQPRLCERHCQGCSGTSGNPVWISGPQRVQMWKHRRISPVGGPHPEPARPHFSCKHGHSVSRGRLEVVGHMGQGWCYQSSPSWCPYGSLCLSVEELFCHCRDREPQVVSASFWTRAAGGSREPAILCCLEGPRIGGLETVTQCVPPWAGCFLFN